jgi:hypothetical protein
VSPEQGTLGGGMCIHSAISAYTPSVTLTSRRFETLRRYGHRLIREIVKHTEPARLPKLFLLDSDLG